MKLSRYTKVFPCEDRQGDCILFAARTGASVLVPSALLQEIEEGGLDPADEETLAGLGFLVPDHEVERRAILGMTEEMNLRQEVFSALVVLNLDCNLGCTYCFEGTLKGKHFMGEETADRLVDVIASGPVARGKSVSLNFYGGEPLLSVPLIRRIAGKVKAVTEERGLSFGFSLMTNGTLLTRQRVEELLPFGLKGATVTLDGPREIHDAARPFTDGRGSFDVIMRNLREVAGLIALQIGGNFTRENYREFPRLFDLLIAEGLTPDRLGPMQFSPVVSTPSSRALPEFTGGCISANEPWVAEAILFLREELLRRGFEPPKMEPHICAVETAENLVVNYDGTFYKCPALIGIEGAEAGDVGTGMRDCRMTHGLGLWQNDECLDCPYLPLCFGGCRYLGFLDNGRIDALNCNRDFFDAFLEPCLKQDIAYRVRSTEG
ncbi:geopeptide radical SAM maturase [Geobacter sp.]|uniref:geopeptide radical SAM maturase n=1 Tax=Geobacter sp. TaxID=46610 RepID=UPI0026321018|nr:geopeptide radical SAM maturase [Geobacter sp.]